MIEFVNNIIIVNNISRGISVGAVKMKRRLLSIKTKMKMRMHFAEESMSVTSEKQSKRPNVLNW